MATFRYATQGGTGTFEAADANAALASLPKDAIKGTGVQAITPAMLAPQKPVQLPMPMTPSDATGAVANGDARLQAMGGLLAQDGNSQAGQKESSKWTDIFAKYFPTEPASTADDFQKSYKESVTPFNEKYFDAYDQGLAAEQRLAGVNARLQGIKAETEAMNLRQEGRQANMAQITGQQAENNRQAAIRALPLQSEAMIAQAEVANAQGKMQLAQQMRQMATEQLNTYFAHKKEDIDNQYNFKKDLFTAISSIMTKEEEREAQKLEKELDRQHDFDLQNLDFEQKKKLEGMKGGEAPKVVSVNGEDMVWNASTGQYEPITTGPSSAKQSEVLGYLSQVEDIISSPYLDQVFGLKNPFTYWTPGSNEQLVKNQVNQLLSALSIEARDKLKGSGAISDYEAKVLQRSTTALGKNLSDVAARRELAKIRGVFATAAGLKTRVKITDPQTGRSMLVDAGREGINQAIMDGATVEYQ